jgi:hypothetical protein
MGQTREVYVRKLVMRDSIEGRILRVQRKYHNGGTETSSQDTESSMSKRGKGNQNSEEEEGKTKTSYTVDLSEDTFAGSITKDRSAMKVEELDLLFGFD